MLFKRAMLAALAGMFLSLLPVPARAEDCPPVWMVDNDGDGSMTCNPGGAGDCDDFDPAVYPGAAEICDGKDNDCDGPADEPDLYYPDLDGDGRGDWAVSARQVECAGSAPQGAWSQSKLDCDDTDPAVYLGAAEICDGKDNDCDGEVDDGVLGTYYPDADQDGYGATYGSPVAACEFPAGYVTAGGDCNDGDPVINPGATEICDGLDNNCDRHIDEDGVCDEDPTPELTATPEPTPEPATESPGPVDVSPTPEGGESPTPELTPEVTPEPSSTPVEEETPAPVSPTPVSDDDDSSEATPTSEEIQPGASQPPVSGLCCSTGSSSAPAPTAGALLLLLAILRGASRGRERCLK